MDCNKCVWGTRDGGCASWECEFIDRVEAVKAWRKMSEANMQLSGKDATSDLIYRQAAVTHCTTIGRIVLSMVMGML